ncbi:MAG: PaaI family thioesterase [Myxococcales bacterium]|nr:PaaI family thioesterase [Myxococcales bacterium]
MSDEGDPAWRAPAARVAEELREIARALAVAELAPASLETAHGLLREARGLLEGDGTRRVRWYDRGGERLEITPASARAYLDQSPIRGRLNPIAPPIAIETAERPDGTPIVIGRAELGLAYEGPPHGVHGGWVAALFDDVLGAAQWLVRSRGVTARLSVQYRHVTPCEEPLRFEAWIEEERGRRVVAHATCHAGETLTAEAEALFLKVDFREIDTRMRSRRAEGDG